MAAKRFSQGIKVLLLAGGSLLLSPLTPAQAAPPVEPVSSLLGTADVVAGKKAGMVCLTCHSVDKGGAVRIGPNLWNIVNRPVGQAPGFHYSAAFKKLTVKSWTYADLNTWLYSPSAAAPGTTMSFVGLKKAQDRANVIAWLRTLSDKPAALPKPK